MTNKVFLSLVSLPLFSFASYLNLNTNLEMNPASSSTLVGIQCPSCSAANPKTFSLSIHISTNNQCTNSENLIFSSAKIDTDQAMYLNSNGLDSYAASAHPPMTGVKCIQIYWPSENSSVLALVSGTPYTRTYPTGNASVLMLS